MPLSVLPREHSIPDVGLYRNSVDNSGHHYLRDEKCRNTKAAETCKNRDVYIRPWQKVFVVSEFVLYIQTNLHFFKVPDFRHFIYTSMKQSPPDTNLFVPLLFKFFTSMNKNNVGRLPVILQKKTIS